MGTEKRLEEQIVAKYGRPYWESNRVKIMERVSKYQARAYPNADERRSMRRHPEDFYFALFWLMVQESLS